MSEIKIEKQVTVTLDTNQAKLLKTLLRFADDVMLPAIRQDQEYYLGYSAHEIREMQEFGEDLRTQI